MVGHLLRLPLSRRFPRVPQGDAASEHSPKLANMRTNRNKVPRATHHEILDRVVREFQDLRRLILFPRIDRQLQSGFGSTFQVYPGKESFGILIRYSNFNFTISYYARLQ